MLCARDGSGGRHAAAWQTTPRGRSDQWERRISPMLNRWASQASSETERAGRPANFRGDETRSAPLLPRGGSRDTAARTPVCIVRATPRAQASRRASEARAHARERREEARTARSRARGSSSRKPGDASGVAGACESVPTPTRSRWERGAYLVQEGVRPNVRQQGDAGARARARASHPRRLRATLFPHSARPLHVAPLADPAPLDAGRHARPDAAGKTTILYKLHIGEA